MASNSFGEKYSGNWHPFKIFSPAMRLSALFLIGVLLVLPACLGPGEPQSVASPEEKADAQVVGEGAESQQALPVAEPPPADATFSGLPELPVQEESVRDAGALPPSDQVPDVIAQPDLPQALRPIGIPVPRPRQVGSEEPHVEDQRLTEVLPKPMKVEQPYQPRQLLPEPAADSGVVYIIPFSTIMVPRQVESRLFDQFIDLLNARGKELDLFFVILKEGVDKVSPQWLAKRRYVTGEIYAYVEESGSLTTDLRARVRIAYFRAHQQDPAFVFEYPTRIFFDRDRSTIEEERDKLADQIAKTLAEELLNAITL